MWLSKHFQDSEFRCKCPCRGLIINPLLIQRLEGIREAISRPMVIICGFRCPTHNAEVGGAAASPHLYGFAVDIAIPDDNYRKNLIEKALRFDICRIGIYWPAMMIHLDIGNYQDSTIWKPDIIWTKQAGKIPV